MVKISIYPTELNSANDFEIGFPQEKSVKKTLYPIQNIQIDFNQLISKRPLVLATNEGMQPYLLQTEIQTLIKKEQDPKYVLILSLMWATGGRVSEILSLKPTRFIHRGQDYYMMLDRPKKRGRPKKKANTRSSVRYIPIWDPKLIKTIKEYIFSHKIKKNSLLFPVCRESVNLHINKVVAECGGANFRISCQTFRDSFAIHLLLHGRPLKYVSQLLGHKTPLSTEKYMNILYIDGSHYMEGIEFL